MAKDATQVLLAETWTDDIDPTDWWISEKLDGVRAFWTGKQFYSRQVSFCDLMIPYFKGKRLGAPPPWFTE
jgi:hypothetical protein